VKLGRGVEASIGISRRRPSKRGGPLTCGGEGRGTTIREQCLGGTAPDAFAGGVRHSQGRRILRGEIARWGGGDSYRGSSKMPLFEKHLASKMVGQTGTESLFPRWATAEGQKRGKSLLSPFNGGKVKRGGEGTVYAQRNDRPNLKDLSWIGKTRSMFLACQTRGKKTIQHPQKI